MKKVLAVILVMAMAGGLTACGSKTSAPAASTASAADTASAASTAAAANESTDSAGEFTYKVGVINVSDSDENCYLAFDTFKKVITAPEFTDKVGNKITVEWTSSDLDVAKQMSNAETLISKGVDCIFMVGCDNDSSASVVEAANKAGIDMFMVASEAVSGSYKFVGFNEYDCGMHQGQFVADNVTEPTNVCVLEGVEGRSATIERGQGINDALAKNEKIKILSQQTGEFTAEKAMQVTEDWIQTYGEDIDWIICEDNKMGQGAIEVLKAANMIDKVKVNSWIVGGTWDADLVRDGYVAYAVNVSFKVLGDTMADVLANYYTGGAIEDRTFMELYDVTPENYSQFFSN